MVRIFVNGILFWTSSDQFFFLRKLANSQNFFWQPCDQFFFLEMLRTIFFFQFGPRPPQMINGRPLTPWVVINGEIFSRGARSVSIIMLYKSTVDSSVKTRCSVKKFVTKIYSPCILHTFQSVIPPHGQWPAPMGSWRVYIWHKVYTLRKEISDMLLRVCIHALESVIVKVCLHR